MHLLIFVIEVVVYKRVGVGVPICSSVGIGSIRDIGSGSSSVGMSVIGGIVGIVDVIASDDVGVVVRVENINTTSMNAFVREWIIQLFRRIILAFLIPRRRSIITSIDAAALSKTQRPIRRGRRRRERIHSATALGGYVPGSRVTTHRDVPIHIPIRQFREVVAVFPDRLTSSFLRRTNGRRAKER